MRIQHNIMAMSAYRNYTNNVSAMQKNLEKLSSGYKINRAGDDAAGLAISEKMRAQITGLETAQKNAKDGISLVQTAEGALTEVHDMLNRMVELATQSANGTYDDATDRAQLQKELDQLCTEIDRIADSSNFNGINLLDGTLGLNTDAFSISSLDAVAASDGTIDISKLVAAKTDGSPAVHMETGSTAAATPAATIDLGDLKVDVEANTKATVTFTIAGTDYSVDLDNTDATAGSTTTAKTYSATDISALLATKLATADKTTGSTGTDAVKLGNAVYEVADASGKVTLTYAGRTANTDGTGTYTAETAFSGTAADAAAMNNSLGFDVTVKSVTNGTQSGGVIHKATNVSQAAAEVVASKAGIDINLSDVVVNGGSLTIDGYTYMFQTDANNAPTAPANGKVINVSAYDEDNWVHAAADLLSKETITGQDSRTWSIGVNGDGTTIHIDQTASSATGKELDTYEKLTGVISGKGASVTAANAGTKIDITESALKEGNTLNIGGEKFVYSNDFTDATTLAAAINNNNNLKGDYTATVEDGSVVIRAKTATGEGPTVLGKGLTLQIGDTAADYNQLNVTVQDCHASSLGIGNLDISTEEAAQAAIDKIKNAINYVSDVRGTLGATQNRLEHTINNLSVMTENIQDAESTIRDVDIAEEMMAYTKNNILIQASQAMLAQANQVPQGVLQLLQ